MNKPKTIAVIGAGGWGTVLAILLAKKYDVWLWCFEKETVDEIAINKTNFDYLPGIELPENIFPITDINYAQNTDIIVNTVPTQFIRSVYSQINFSFENKILVNGAKGIEKNSLKRISEIFSETVDINHNNYAALSGPSHAEEVARQIPTVILAASKNIELAKTIREIFSTNNFRVYSSEDVIGCEIGGALKNVISIAAGIVDGLKLGDNTKAALITRGLAEISRLGIALGANPLTFSGLSGLGDLVVTCYSNHSRNRKVGELIGQGFSLDEIKKMNKSVAEGIDTTISTYEFSKRMNIEMPITEQVYNALHCGINQKDCVEILMTRAKKNEVW